MTQHLRSLLLIAALVLGLAGLAVLLLLRWYERRIVLRAIGTGRGRVVAVDREAAPAPLLRAPSIGLRGRPDYLLEEVVDGTPRLVPMELKPTRRSRRLYESDAVQLGVYLLALRDSYGPTAGAFGYVRYANDTFRVELTPELEHRVLATAAAVRAGRRAAVLHRSHQSPARCAGCAVRQRCDESLA